MKIIFLGDIALNGKYIDLYKQDINPFAGLSPLLSNADYVVGNLESIAKGDQGENELKTPRLTTSVETLGFLKNIRLDVACLAQNHVYDHLADGFKKTTSFLKENDIKFLGAGISAIEAVQPVILTKGGIRVGILNYVTHDTNPKLPADASVTSNFFEEQRATEEVLALRKKVDHIVLSLHWGGRVEGGLFPDFHQPRLARKLIDAGADLIIGHHSHTFQPYEQYKGKYVFYSLGNFCFSDYWFEGRYQPQPKRRRLTGIVEINFSGSGYSANTRFYRNHITDFKQIKGNPVKANNVVFNILKRIKPLWLVYFLLKKNVLPVWFFVMRKDIRLNEKISRILHKVKKYNYHENLPCI